MTRADSKVYSEGVSATCTAPLPEKSPVALAQLQKAELVRGPCNCNRWSACLLGV